MEVPPQWDVVVYIKDVHHHMAHVAKLMKRAVVVRLPNVGRESQTWFSHIYRTYYRLDDLTVFVQGNPWDHTPNMGEILHCESIHEMAERMAVVFSGNKHVNKPDKGFVSLGESWRHDWRGTGEDPQWDIAERPMFAKIWELRFGHPNHPGIFNAVNGNQFAITKSTIERLSRDFYGDVFLWHFDPKNWVLPWTIEKVMAELYLYDEEKVIRDKELQTLPIV